MKAFLFSLLVIFFLEVTAQTSVFSISFTTTPASCQKGSALLQISGGSGNVSVLWEDGSFGIWKNGLEAGNYFINISDTAGNDTSVVIVIDPQPCFLKGEASFSPNGDGINDIWNVSNTSFYNEFLIQVFNRWGQKVFETTDEMTGWDGTWKGQAVPDGTYYYIAEFTDKYFGKQKKNGSVTILR